MRRLSDRLTSLAKSSSFVDKLLRYNPLYYGSVKRLLGELDDLDIAARRVLWSRLTQRTLSWATSTRAGRGGSGSLRDWPVIEKSSIRDRPEEFRKSGRIRMSASTSGSSGIPVKVQRSLRCVAAEQAFIDNLLRPWNITFRTARVANLRVDSVKPIADRRPPYGAYSHGGRRLILSSDHLSSRTVKWFRDELHRFAPDVLFTHPSSGEALAKFIQECGLRLRLPLVLTSSEILYPPGRRLMETVFEAAIIDYYGQAERVAFAASVAEETYYFNPAYGRVELLPLDDVEAPPDCRAVEILATSFWNDVMPLVRYRTGDRAIVDKSYGLDDLEDVALGLKPVISIHGREKEFLMSPRGEVLVGFSNSARGIDGLIRMQIIQESVDYVRICVIVDPRVGEIDQDKLIKNVRHSVPDDMKIAIEVVDEVESSPSGKKPFVIRRS